MEQEEDYDLEMKPRDDLADHLRTAGVYETSAEGNEVDSEEAGQESWCKSNEGSPGGSGGADDIVLPTAAEEFNEEIFFQELNQAVSSRKRSMVERLIKKSSSKEQLNAIQERLEESAAFISDSGLKKMITERSSTAENLKKIAECQDIWKLDAAERQMRQRQPSAGTFQSVSGKFAPTTQMALPPELEIAIKRRKNELKKEKPPKKLKGYGLKSLAKHFEIDSTPILISDVLDKVPKNVPATEKIEYLHTDEGLFGEWVKYSTRDAYYTLQLFMKLTRELRKQPWKTELPTDDPAAAAAVHPGGWRGRGYTVWTKESSTKSTSSAAKRANGGRNPNMWDFYQRYYKPFGELLNAMECRGVPLDVPYLKEIEQKAAADERRYRDQLNALILEHCDEMREPERLNLASSIQLRTFLFGGRGKNIRTQERIPIHREFDYVAVDQSKSGGIVDGAASSSSPQAGGRSSTSTSSTTPAAAHLPRQDCLSSDTAKKEPLPVLDLSQPLPLARRASTKRTFMVCGLGLSPQGKNNDTYTPTGWPKTCTSSLEELRRHCLEHEKKKHNAEIIDLIIKIKQASSMLAYFIRPLQVLAQGGRVHPSLVLDTATGRLACRAPNLQNQPALEKDHYRVGASES